MNERQVSGSAKKPVNDRDWVVPAAAACDQFKSFAELAANDHFAENLPFAWYVGLVCVSQSVVIQRDD